MADLLKSSVIGIEADEAQQSEGPSISLQQVAVNRLRRHLSRTITQPRGLYESIIDAYGTFSEPDFLQSEASQVDEAYKSLHASCSSDTETCSSYEDGQESLLDSVHDPKDGPETRGGKSRSRRRHESQKRGEIQTRSDEEWAKSILARRTGYGCLQRNQVSKYITQLETTVGELQLEVFGLSPQVILLKHHRWILQDENDKLKQKIAELSRHQFFKEDQNSALKKELRSLRSKRADYLEQAERRHQDTVPSSKEGSHTWRGGGGEARADLTIVQQPSRRTTPSDKGTAKKDLEGLLPRVPKESSRGQEKTASMTRSSPSSQKEPQADIKVSRQLSLVKWPSSLYRSVSAIRKDDLEIAIEEPTVN